MIAPYFVPRRRVGSQRPYKFVAHLQEFGWKSVVCTLEERREHCSQREKQTLKDIQVIRISPPFDRSGKNLSMNEQKGDSLLSRITKRLADWFDRQVPMDTWYFVFRRSYKEILEKAKTVNPDVIWSTGDPWSGHWVGHKLSRDLNKPWIADFRDPWTLTDLNLRKRSWFSSSMDKKLERKFVANADKLVFTSQSTEETYQDFYNLSPGKTATIYNSYYQPELEPADIPEWNADLDDDYLNVLFFGSFRRLSPVLPIANALSLVAPQIKNCIRIHSFGSFEEEDLKSLQERDLHGQFITHEKVLPQMAQSVFNTVDVLLVSTSGERKTIIPAKLWDYLISDKPILSITPNPEIARILNDTSAGIHFLNESAEEIAEWLTNAVHKKRNDQSLLDNADGRSDIDRYSSRSTTHQLAELMNELTSHE